MPDRNPDATPAASTGDAEIARLAAEFGDHTHKALALARVAADSESPADQRAAGRAMLDARRPAAARRLAALALQADPDSAEGQALLRDAERGLTEARRSRARTGEDFIRETLALVRAAVDAGAGRALGVLLRTNVEAPELDGLVVSRDGEAGVSALDFVNAVLARLGAGGLALVGREGSDGFVATGARRVELRVDRQPTVLELVAAASADGAACNGCGAPRFMVAHDDDLGEFCSVCAYPLAPEHLAMHKQRATVGSLTAELVEVKRDRDRHAALAAEARKQVEGLEGKIGKLAKQVDIEKGRRLQLIAAGKTPIDRLLADPNATVEELKAAAAGAAGQAQASADVAARVAVEISRREGRGAPPG